MWQTQFATHLEGTLVFSLESGMRVYFKPSMTFIEALEEELAQSDFAVLTLTPDDQTESRGKVSMAPRDNVLFELGLFMGRLGRNRTYFVCDKNQEVKIPTDLLGVEPATYEMGGGQKLEDAIAVACSPIAKRMRELDFRLKQSSQTENESRLIIKFCERIAGTWWGRQRGDEVRLSLFRIAFDEGTNAVQLDGDTFDQKGQLFGQWKSVAIAFQVEEGTLFFLWEGTHPTISPGDTFTGFGHYAFKETAGMYRPRKWGIRRYPQGGEEASDLEIGRTSTSRCRRFGPYRRGHEEWHRRR